MIYFGVILFFLVEYIRPGNYLGVLNAARVNTIVPFGVLLAVILSQKKLTSKEFFSETNTKLLITFVVLICGSVLVADVTMKVLTIFTTVLGYVLVYWVILEQGSSLSRIKGLFGVLVAIHLILAALTPEMFTDSSVRHYLKQGTFMGDGNDYALSVNIAIPLCLFLMFEARNAMGKLLYATMLLGLVACVIVTQSRGGTLALVAMAVYYWSKSERKVVTAGLAFVALAVVLAVAPPTYFQRIESIADYENNGSAQGRIIAWKAGVRMAMSNPLLGVGANQFPNNYTLFAVSGTGEPETRWKTAHSIYFLILGELGVPGLVLLLALIGTNLRANRRAIQELKGRDGPEAATARQLLTCLSASVLAYAVAGAFLSAVYYPHIFVLAGLCTASRRLVARTAMATETALAPRPSEGISYHWALRGTLGAGRSS